MNTTSSASGLVVLEKTDSEVAIIRLGATSERVVSLTFERLKSLSEALAQLRESKPRGVIIAGPAPEMFTVGADINAIKGVTDAATGERLAREGQRIYDEIEAMPMPVVAAISGPCVGGGCELALACHYRVSSDHPTTRIGLPEVQLGIIPGFGGTQRLPRLIGLTAALDIILAGKTLRPSQALRRGLVDCVVAPDQLIERAVSLINSHSKKCRKKSWSLQERLLTSTSFGREMVRKNAAKKLQDKTKGFYPAPMAALSATLFGLEHGIKAGLENEARELGRMVVTAESRSLVYVFTLSEAAKALGKSGRKFVEGMRAIVIGAGAMGAGIAGACARAEIPVTLKDTTDNALKRGLQQIKDSLDRSSSLSEKDRSFILNRIEATTKDLINAGTASFAVEAIFEDLEVKRRVLDELSRLLPQEAVLATNTSSLSVTEIAKPLSHRERVVGMHFFNPVDRMPLVEIVMASETSDKTLAIVSALAVKLGKFPIIVRDVPGFLVNRILTPYLNEAAFLLQEGISIKEIDLAATSFGMPMGPLRLLDDVGLDVATHVSEIMAKGYPDRMIAPNLASQLLAQGRKGHKSGGGFYNYSQEHVRSGWFSRGRLKERAVPAPEVQTILNLPHSEGLDRAHITDRLLLAMINEAARSLDEGVAGQPGPEAAGQIDLGSVMGFGFPAFRGGIIRYMDQIGAGALLTKLETLHKQHGARFKPAPGIVARAAKGVSFYQKI